MVKIRERKIALPINFLLSSGNHVHEINFSWLKSCYSDSITRPPENPFIEACMCGWP